MTSRASVVPAVAPDQPVQAQVLRSAQVVEDVDGELRNLCAELRESPGGHRPGRDDDADHGDGVPGPGPDQDAGRLVGDERLVTDAGQPLGPVRAPYPPDPVRGLLPGEDRRPG